MWLTAMQCLAVAIGLILLIALTLADGFQLKQAWRLSPLALAIGLAAFGPGALFANEDRFNWWVAGISGGAMTGVIARWVYRIHRPRRFARKLRDPGTRTRTLAALKSGLEAAFVGGKLTRSASRDVIGASAALIEIGEDKFAAEWLSRVDLAGLHGDTRAQAANNEAVAWLASGKIAAARAALNKAGAVTDGNLRSVLGSTEALVLALEGSHEDALARIAGLSGALGGADIESTVLEVEASAYAGLGRLQESEDALQKIAAKYGRVGLARLVARGGPASAAARALLANLPYR